MPAAGATAIGTGRIPGQEAIDLSVCIAILKKTIVAMPVVIMIILYLIRRNMTQPPDEQQTFSNETVEVTDTFANHSSFANSTAGAQFEVVRDLVMTKRLRRLLKLDQNNV